MEERHRPGVYRWILKEQSRVAVSILDSNPVADPEFFVSVIRFDDFLVPGSLEGLRNLERKSGVSIHGLGDLEQALETQFQREKAKGIVGLKSGLAYQRPIDYRKPERGDAERVLNRLLAGDPDYRWCGDRAAAPETMRILTDYMMHRVLRLAEESGLPFQIHTGIQEGNSNDIRNSDPKLLIPLFQEYPRVAFDIFHSGYPFLSDLTVIAKNFPNVYIDMCWMHIISPSAARRALAEYLDAVPANKIMAFGGDYCFVEGVYGHQKIARKNVATVLAEMVCDGYCGRAEAEDIAVRLLQQNPVELFRLTRDIPDS
jgi:predicted TIM-barrel fold metal-dependent hydrolase